MEDFQLAAGFNDLWRAVGGRRVKGQGPPIAFRAQVTRMVRHAPEVVVSVTGAQKTRRALGDRLDYMSRHGTLLLEGRDGERVDGMDGLRDIMDDWSTGARFNSHATRATPISRSLVLSTPEGVDREAVARGVGSFCSAALADRFDFLAARHDDTACPHWHLIVRALGDDGTIFTLNPDNLIAWREGFAEHLRRQGVEVEATSRSARGVSLKADTPKFRHAVEAYQEGRVKEPPLLQARRREAERLAAGGDATLQPAEVSLLAQRKRVRSAFARLAKALKASPAGPDQDLGRDIDAFLQTMPSAHSGRFRLAQQMAAQDLQRAIHRMDRERSRNARPGPALER